MRARCKRRDISLRKKQTQKASFYNEILAGFSVFFKWMLFLKHNSKSV